ncbi:MAG: hypothetical protein PHU40_06220 [Sulfurimonas sp.]|nr:hypothetical protein [Sulfurimonas sp.]
MVKISFFLLLLFSFSFADLLDDKIESFMDSHTYDKNKDYIKILFSPKSSFYDQERLNAVKIVQTLKENGLLNLSLKVPQELHLRFKTNGSPLFFVRIMSESLRDIGYYRYVTESSNLDNSEFTWSIVLTAENATDPMLLQNELAKKGCNIIDIDMNSLQEWKYTVDMQKAFLNIETLQSGNSMELKRSLYAHWLEVSKINQLRIKSSARNEWHPYVAFYDKALHLLELVKMDAKQTQINLEVPKYAKYMKVSDLYTLKNIKDELFIEPLEAR